MTKKDNFEVQGAAVFSIKFFPRDLCIMLCDVNNESKTGALNRFLTTQISNAACVLGTVNDKNNF